MNTLINELESIQIIYLILVFISVSLWEYVIYQTKTEGIRYNEGFNIFSLIQWIAIATGLISIFGIKIGLLMFAFTITLLQYICHFTIGLLLNHIASYKKDIPLALFSVIVWVLGIFSLFIAFTV